MRTYAHLFTCGDTCEAKGCRIRTRSLWRTAGGVVQACTAAHAAAADAALERGDRQRVRRPGRG